MTQAPNTGTEKRSLVLTPASEIRSRKQKFAWKDFIPLGTVTTFAGKGGEGKSSFCLYLGARIQAGDLEGDLFRHPRSMLIVGPEDNWETVMKPRLVAAGADLDTVFKLTIASTVDETTRETVPALPLDIDLLREAITTTNAGLVMIDPITSTIGGDLHKVSDVRAALDPLVALAQETDTAIVTVMHFAKGAGNVSDKISGSHAFRDAARSVMAFATDEETGQRVVTLDKSNYSSARGKSFAFNLVNTVIKTDDGETDDVAHVEFLGESDISVSDIVNRPVDRDDDGAESDRSEAERWILSYLEEKGGAAPAKDILKAARGDGIETQTVQRASRRLVDKAKSGFQGQWVWTLNLSKDVTKKSKMSGPSSPDIFDTFGGNVTPLVPNPRRDDRPKPKGTA